MGNNKKIFLGSIFIILSGIIYEIEKALSYFKWAVDLYKVVNIGSGGGYNSQPDRVYLSNNYFIILFLLIGLCFYVGACMPLIKKNT